MCSHHHAGDLALRLLKMSVNWDFEQNILLSKSAKLDKNDSHSERLWLKDLYTPASRRFLFSIVTSQNRRSVEDVMVATRTTKNYL